MRVILASLFVFAGLLFAVAFLPHWTVIKFWVIPFALGMTMYFFVLCSVALFIFNVSFARPAPPGPTVEELEQQGLIVATDFEATRAFKINEFEDEGPYYFIELADASILYLNGQYLYDDEGDDLLDDDELEGEPRHYRQFPCTSFTIRRHRDEKYVIDLQCSDNLLPLETVEFEDDDYIKLFDAFCRTIPNDGQIITDWTYDALKQRMSGANDA